MARQSGSSTAQVFVVTPFQFDDETAVQGVSFPTAMQAQNFGTKVANFARKQAAKIMGLSGDEAKEFTNTIAMDILIQSVDANGEAIGDPAVFGNVGLLDEDED